MGTIFHIVLGLLGLSFIVLIHELGHFFVARFCKVHVERLCLFLGKPLVTWKWGATEFAIAWLPLGGYCKMKNEGLALQDFGNKAQESKDDQNEFLEKLLVKINDSQSNDSKINNSAGKDVVGKSFQEISALQKIFIIAAGPAINILFAFLVLFLFQLGGYPDASQSNRIVIPHSNASTRLPQNPSPAKKAGLRSGDVIVQIGNTKIADFADIRLAVALSAGENLRLDYLRNGRLLRSTIRPVANAEGRGWIGVLPWTDLVLQTDVGQSSSAISHKMPQVSRGARLEQIDGQPVANWYELLQELRQRNQQENVVLQWHTPAGQTLQQSWNIAELGQLQFQSEMWVRSLSVWQAIAASYNKLEGMLVIQIQGLGQLLRGRLKLQGNLAGPLQISDQIGQVIAGPSRSFIHRWHNIWLFLSFISFMIALANLLPLAVLDGGQILLYSIEWLARRRLPPRWVMVYQSVGSLVIVGLVALVLSMELMHYIL